MPPMSNNRFRNTRTPTGKPMLTVLGGVAHYAGNDARAAKCSEARG
jgi:hypothetical protein